MHSALRRATALAVTFVPTAALAHPGHGEPHPFFHGFADHLDSLDFTLGMIAAGLALALLLSRRTRDARSWRPRP